MSNKESICLYVISDHYNGGLTAWSTWSTCSSTCGPGKHVRTRKCQNPLPSTGGQDCPDTLPLFEVADCDAGTCPAPIPSTDTDQWYPWTTWYPCKTLSDGSNFRVRHRLCITRRCQGDREETDTTCTPDSTVARRKRATDTCSDGNDLTLSS